MRAKITERYAHMRWTSETGHDYVASTGFSVQSFTKRVYARAHTHTHTHAHPRTCSTIQTSAQVMEVQHELSLQQYQRWQQQEWRTTVLK